MTFAERVEQRANHMFSGRNRTQDELDAARDVIVLEWAAANQGAIEALVEGTAGVIATIGCSDEANCRSRKPASGGIWIQTDHDGDGVWLTRLDTPQEKK